MTEYEKDCEALERVKKAAAAGRMEYNGGLGAWHESTCTMGAYRIKPEPCRVPLELTDWAGGPWWVREGEAYSWVGISFIDQESISLVGGKQYTHERMMDQYERTRDFVNIEPCSKEGGAE